MAFGRISKDGNCSCGSTKPTKWVHRNTVGNCCVFPCWLQIIVFNISINIDLEFQELCIPMKILSISLHPILPHLTTSMEAAPDLKKSVVSSMAATLLRMPFQMFFKKIKKLISFIHIFVFLFLKNNSISITYPDFICHFIFIISQLYAGAFSRGEVFGSRDHLSIFKLQILHQELWIKWYTDLVILYLNKSPLFK